jgi:hypothetical protein
MRFGTRLLFVIAAVASLAGPSAAETLPFPYVTTLSSIFSGGVDDNYDSVTGLSQHPGSCFLQGGGTGPCATLSSSPSTNTLGLTAASVAITNGVAFDPNNGISGFGAASASADLASGIVGVYANGPNCSTPNASGCDSGGSATAEFQDSLTFTNTTGNAVNIGINWSFDGTTVSLGTFPAVTATSLFCFGPGTACAGNPNGSPHGPNAVETFTFTDSNGSTANAMPTGGWVSTAVTPGANATSETFHGVFTIPTGVSTDSLNAWLEVSCLISTCDFSHTGAFTFDTLPSGVTFNSSSGVLLTAASPEPGTWALSLGALALFAVRRNRKPIA